MPLQTVAQLGEMFTEAGNGRFAPFCIFCRLIFLFRNGDPFLVTSLRRMNIVKINHNDLHKTKSISKTVQLLRNA